MSLLNCNSTYRKTQNSKLIQKTLPSTSTGILYCSGRYGYDLEDGHLKIARHRMELHTSGRIIFTRWLLLILLAIMMPNVLYVWMTHTQRFQPNMMSKTSEYRVRYMSLLYIWNQVIHFLLLLHSKHYFAAVATTDNAKVDWQLPGWFCKEYECRCYLLYWITLH